MEKPSETQRTEELRKQQPQWEPSRPTATPAVGQTTTPTSLVGETTPPTTIGKTKEKEGVSKEEGIPTEEPVVDPHPTLTEGYQEISNQLVELAKELENRVNEIDAEYHISDKMKAVLGQVHFF